MSLPAAPRPHERHRLHTQTFRPPAPVDALAEVDMPRSSGDRVLVVGGAGGIGREVCRRLAARGGRMVVAAAVVRALTRPRPRFRYVVGINARKAHWAKRLLGTDLALRVMARFSGFRFFY